MSFAQALCRAIDAANSEGDFETEQRLVALAETVDGTPSSARRSSPGPATPSTCWATRSAGWRCSTGPCSCTRHLPPSPELVDCLSTHILFLNLQGRYDESDAAILRAFEALDAVGDDGGAAAS